MQKEYLTLNPYVFIGVNYQEIRKRYKKDSRDKKTKHSFKITQNQIIDIVAKECDVTISEILSKSRKKEIVDARYLCFAAIKLRCGLSLEHIGNIMDNRDHTTVIYGLVSFHNRYKSEQHYKEKADRVFRIIQLDYDGSQLTTATD